MYVIQESEYIEHYGVLGMKWGVHKTPERLSNIKEKQIKKADKYWGKKIETSAKKLKKAEEKGKIKSIKKYSNKLNSESNSYLRERDYINKMNWDDISKENTEVGKAFVKSFFITTGSLVLSPFTGGYSIISVPSPGNIRRNYRTK